MYRNNFQNKHQNSSNNARISFLMWVFLVLIALYFYNFFLKSVIEHPNIIKIAKEQYIIQKEIPSIRGNIYFSDKKTVVGHYPMASNEEKFEVMVVPKNMKDKQESAKKLAQVLDLDASDLYEKVNNEKLYLPSIAKRLSKEKIKEVIELNLPGVMVISTSMRIYPEDNLPSQIVGFVDAEEVGRYGLEGYYHDELRGVGGEVVAEKDILGRFISVEKQINAKNGFNIFTTIDRNIQYVTRRFLSEAIEEMDAEKGRVVILEPKTGKILSMVNLPDYDPNKYFETAQEHPELFMNPIISNEYEPGSVLKPLVMSMAMDLGKVEPDTIETFGGHKVVQGYEIRNAMNRTFGKQTMTQVLENSDNVGMIWVSESMSNEEMYKYMQGFGFGKNTGIDIDGEASGTLIDIDNWRPINKATMSFGQGIAMTPLQLAMAYASLANNGIVMRPYVVEKIQKNDDSFAMIEPQELRRVVTDDTSQKISNMLVSTVENGYDTEAQVEGYRIAGKTGTAQIANPDGGYLKDEFVHTFAGYFPADDPQFVMILILDKPTKHNFASSTCAPTYSRLAKWLLNYNQIKSDDQ